MVTAQVIMGLNRICTRWSPNRRAQNVFTPHSLPSQTSFAFAEKQKFWRKMRIKFADWIKVCIFALRKDWNGLMAEWLGRGLQNLVQRFESASDLMRASLTKSVRLALFADSHRRLPPACISAPPKMATAALSRWQRTSAMFESASDLQNATRKGSIFFVASHRRLPPARDPSPPFCYMHFVFIMCLI